MKYTHPPLLMLQENKYLYIYANIIKLFFTWKTCRYCIISPIIRQQLKFFGKIKLFRDITIFMNYVRDLVLFIAK